MKPQVIKEALKHAGRACSTEVKITWLDAERYEERHLSEFDGILIPGGFGKRGIEGKIDAIRYARTGKIPLLGLCLGFQLSVVEYARNVLGWENAMSAELGEGRHVIGILPEQQGVTDLGGTMRLGNYPVTIRENTLAMRIYGQAEITERHRHRYEVNPLYIPELEKAGLVFSGTWKKRMEIGEVRVEREHNAAHYLTMTTGTAKPSHSPPSFCVSASKLTAALVSTWVPRP